MTLSKILAVSQNLVPVYEKGIIVLFFFHLLSVFRYEFCRSDSAVCG